MGFIHNMVCCRQSGNIFTGAAEPNGVQDGAKYDIYIQVPGDGSALIWVKTTDDGGNTGWV